MDGLGLHASIHSSMQRKRGGEGGGYFQSMEALLCTRHLYCMTS